MKKDSRVNHARYVELYLFPEEKENLLKDSLSPQKTKKTIPLQTKSMT